jgi:hypothetical protein
MMRAARTIAAAAPTIADPPADLMMAPVRVAGAVATVSRGAGDAADRTRNVQVPPPDLTGDAPDLRVHTANMCARAPDVTLRALTIAARASCPRINAPSAVRHSKTAEHCIRLAVSCRRRSGARAGGLSIVRPIHIKEEQMQIRQGRLLDALRGIQAFLDEHTDVLGTIPQSGARQKLDAQVAELTAHAVAQDGSHRAAKDATQTQYALRRAVLRDHMAPIARIAAAELPPAPALAALGMPTRRLTTPQLHAAAMGMADTAEPHAAVFTSSALPDDFLTQLRNAANDLLVPIDTRTRSRSVRKGATASLADQAKSVRKTVGVLDALVKKQIKGNTDLLTRWQAVKRPPAKAARGSTTPPVTPVAPVPDIPAAPVASPAAATAPTTAPQPLAAAA